MVPILAQAAPVCQGGYRLCRLSAPAEIKNTFFQNLRVWNGTNSIQKTCFCTGTLTLKASFEFLCVFALWLNGRSLLWWFGVNKTSLEQFWESWGVLLYSGSIWHTTHVLPRSCRWSGGERSMINTSCFLSVIFALEKKKKARITPSGEMRIQNQGGVLVAFVGWIPLSLSYSN